MSQLALAPGTLLISPRAEDDDPVFRRSVILLVDHEPNGIISGLVLNQPTTSTAADTSALVLLFISDPSARVFWGGPMGSDPAILAHFSSTDGLEWFHLPKRMLRPFPLPEVGVVAVAEHPEPFADRIRQARLYQGLCVWSAGQLEAELRRDQWLVAQAALDDIFTPDPETLWSRRLPA